MAQNCFKCGKGNEKDKDVTLFQVPIGNRNAKWQMEFLDRLGIQDCLYKDVYICSRHLLPEDFEMKNSVLHLKENALPVRIDENIGEELEVKPELIFVKNKDDIIEVNTDSMSDTSETKDLAPLEPLVEYINVYENVRDEVEFSSDIKSETLGTEIQTVSANVIIDSEYVTEDNHGHEISIMNSDGDNLNVDPVMPFFLTSSPMFTILNENNEEETIILQIENTNEKKFPLPLPHELDELHQSLCKSVSGSLTTTYSCDICDSSFGCLNCLKSHYETFHIYNAIRQYKCKFSHHVSKSLVCPVCELTFQSRTETMDHYITHSVGCDICGSGFDRHTYLAEHYKTVHNKGDHQAYYECELCKMTYQYPATLNKHYRTFHKMTLCHVCKVRFDSVSELQEHEKVHQEKLNVLPFACSKCDKAFPKISDIAVHIRQDHKRESVIESETVEVSVRPQKAKKDGHTPVQKKVKVEK